MKKIFLTIVFAVLTMSTAIFAQQPVVAVAPFDAISGISATDAAMLTRVFFIRLGNTKSVQPVDRNLVDRIIQEHKFQAGDWSDAQKTAELGKALNADWLVKGELEKFGDSVLVTVQFFDIQTFRFIGGADLMLANASEAMEKMDPLVNKLVETIASASVERPNLARPGQKASGNAEAQRLFERGIMFLERKDYDTAITDFAAAIRLDNNFTAAYISRGDAYFAKQENDAAINDYTTAIRLDPNSIDAYSGRGKAYKEKNDHNRGIADLTQAIRLQPNNYKLYSIRGDIYRSQGDYNRAITDYTQAIQLEPNDDWTYLMRGFIYYQQKNYDRAISDYTQVIMLTPDSSNGKTALYWRELAYRDKRLHQRN